MAPEGRREVSPPDAISRHSPVVASIDAVAARHATYGEHELRGGVCTDLGIAAEFVMLVDERRRDGATVPGEVEHSAMRVANALACLFDRGVYPSEGGR